MILASVCWEFARRVFRVRPGVVSTVEQSIADRVRGPGEAKRRKQIPYTKAMLRVLRATSSTFQPDNRPMSRIEEPTESPLPWKRAAWGLYFREVRK
jgi:hypothetical protein